MIDKESFLEKYRIRETFERADLEWDFLEEIYRDYEQNYRAEYAETARRLEQFLSKSAKELNVPAHSIGSREKDPEHLIEKICRKRGKQQIKKYLDITRENYREIVRDLVGVRILTVSKEEWEPVCDMLMKLFPNDPKSSSGCFMVEEPKAFIRIGDRDIIKDKISTEPTIDYRSQHYIVKFEDKYCEIQVRSLIEEAFGEFNHRVKYPYRQENPFLERYSISISQLLDSANELISMCLEMGEEQWEKNAEHFGDTKYFVVGSPNFYDLEKRESTKVTSDMQIGDMVNAEIYAWRVLHRR